MKDKLQPGDYVTDLTEEQFKELLYVEKHDGTALSYSSNGLAFDGQILIHVSVYRPLKTKLPYEEFLRRAKNTF